MMAPKSRTLEQVAEAHLRKIRAHNKRYPLMEYFLEGKPLRDCSAECQWQVAELKSGEEE